MKRDVLVYGLIGGLAIAILKWIEYRFFVIDHSAEIYSGLISAVFAILGLWLGSKWTANRIPKAEPVTLDLKKPEAFGLTRREFEILELIAQGLSNREIAGKRYVSKNTVKTHSSRVLGKIRGETSTQAVQIGKEMGLLR